MLVYIDDPSVSPLKLFDISRCFKFRILVSVDIPVFEFIQRGFSVESHGTQIGCSLRMR
jgi:hypothetical protein